MQRSLRRHLAVRSLRAAALSILLPTLLLLAPAMARAADPTFPPASRVGLAPPPGFVLATNFLGFRHNDKQAMIVMAELPGYAYDNIDKEITGELAKNPQLATRSEIPLREGLRGFLLKGTEQSPQGPVLKWTLVATAHNVTAVATVLIPEAVQDVAPEPAVMASLQSLAIRASVPNEEMLSVLPFDLRELAGFRILRVQPGSAAMLTDGPKDAIEAAEQPIILVAFGGGNVPPAQERDGFARRMIGETPGLKEMRFIRSEPLRIANQQGHEVLIEAKDAKSDVDVTAVQWLRFGSASLLRIFAIARKDTWNAVFPRLRQVRDGVQPR